MDLCLRALGIFVLDAARETRMNLRGGLSTGGSTVEPQMGPSSVGRPSHSAWRVETLKSVARESEMVTTGSI